jgi:hypothetical protein
MEMKKMNGGSLRAAGYDERARKLVVELTAGTFEYTGVPSEVWRRFSTASSPWSYYRDNIEEEFTGRRGTVRPKATNQALEDLFKAPDKETDN